MAGFARLDVRRKEVRRKEDRRKDFRGRDVPPPNRHIRPPAMPANRDRPLSFLRAWMLVLPVDIVALAVPIPWHLDYLGTLVLMAVLILALLGNGGLYRSRLHLSFLDELPAVAGRVLVAAALVAGATAVRQQTESVDDLLRAAALMLVLLLASRFVTFWLIRYGRRRRLTGHLAVLVGSGPVAADLAHVLRRHRTYGLDLVGYLDDPPRPESAPGGLPALGDLSELPRVLTAHRADVLIIADPHAGEAQVAGLLQEAMAHTYDIIVVPRMHRFQTETPRPDHIGAIPIMRIRPATLSGWKWALKRSLDVVVSASALLLLSPVMALCALAVLTDGGRGVLFRQQRVGHDGKIFNLLKFRSLRPADETEAATTWSVAHDRRVGRAGRFLRRTSLDELPQLWNIFRGDMTLVGPRPERPHFVERFSAEHPHYAQRHRVPVGLTGLAQVSGLRGDTPISDRARFDNYYIENWSLWLDLKIIIRTVREVITAAGR